ncbi:unnamed protein product [Paramecium sonneborni]|uniref:Insulin-like growth factor binding protein, N-terminal n=1 Tax=Paramecium sonneborni TaxID=65129 RepID=A0A8S1R4V1_9CILI|nr:unnamed protein product [Paramecium sonneborni]
MNIPISFILVTLIDFSNSQWQLNYGYLYYDRKFSENEGGLLLANNKQANFITCTTPPTSYYTLNSQYPLAYDYTSLSNQKVYFFSVDLYFQGTWISEIVTITIGSFQYQYNYTTSTKDQLTTGFCGNIAYEVKTVNFKIQLSNSSVNKFQFTLSNMNNGQVSIRNLFISFSSCYPSCSQCKGPNFNQCTSCYYGIPTNNICPPCPSNQYYEKRVGCKDICSIYTPLYSNGFCQSYQNRQINQYAYMFKIESYNFYWFNVYDPLHLDTSPTFIEAGYIQIFKFNSGFSTFIQSFETYSQAIYSVGFQIIVRTYNDIPLNCGIQFLINNTYFSSIYRNETGIQKDKIKIYEASNYGSYLNYTSSHQYTLITYIDLPNYPFLFSAKGNYSDNSAGWGFQGVTVTSGYCPINCILCEVSFKCKTCKNGYYIHNNNTCQYACLQPYQKLKASYCYDFDNETPYSQYLTIDFINYVHDPEQYEQYMLISQNGTNFLKGLDIYYSNLNWNSIGQRIFGGPLIWAQAKFQRTHYVDDPHHSITIAFYILYGPAFPSDGLFIYTIENNPPVSKSTKNTTLQYSNGAKYDKTYERIIHDTNTLTISWECFGPNNEPVQAYCGFYNYYIAVHKCQPYCLQCSNETTCLQWNSDYDANVVKFSQKECLINKYFDKDSYRCLDCPRSCLACTSKLDCQTCQSTYTQTRLGCVCKQNQYEYSNQCFDCPIECKQCLSSNNCIECLITNNRQLKNQQCICIDGYYPVLSNPQCQNCHLFCKTCTGPTSDDCLTCNNITNIEQFEKTCRCPAGLFYQATTNSCFQCHSSCQTCFQGTDENCQTCDASLNRILKELKCICVSGYYELNSICTNCPNTEDILLTSCYKFCTNTEQLWHTNECISCDPGFHLISGECQPICGDLQIIGYEQCENDNTIQDYLCYNCQYQCPAHCLTCNEQTIFPCPDICGDEIITGMEECEDGNTIQYDGCFDCKFQCQPSCTKCIKGECFECNTGGWYTDITVLPWICKENCGDRLIVGQEQCDDDNQDDTDGCKDCKFLCRIGCSTCDYTTGNCLNCELPGFAPEKYYCKNICGDGLVATDPLGIYSEECDDGNKVNYDGCNNNCKFQCQSSSICKSCVNNRCEQCATGFLLYDSKICLSKCGDSLVGYNEQCEVSQILPYKGCQNCKAKCQSACIKCDNTGLGCLVCKVGYKRIDNLCYSICGDKIVTEDEECDDGNLKFGDGCHQCYFSCPCSMCIDRICVGCPEDHFLYKYTCFNLIEKIDLKEITNFSFTDLSISQTFEAQPGQTNRIQLKIVEFFQKVFNQISQNIEIIDQNFPYINIEITLRCSKNKNVNMHFIRSNNDTGIYNQDYIFTYQCHETANHIITLSFRLNKIMVRDELILIKISEDELQLYALLEQSPQRLLWITYVNL